MRYKVGDILTLRVLKVGPGDVIRVEIDDGQQFDIVSPPKLRKPPSKKQLKRVARRWLEIMGV